MSNVSSVPHFLSRVGDTFANWANFIIANPHSFFCLSWGILRTGEEWSEKGSDVAKILKWKGRVKQGFFVAAVLQVALGFFKWKKGGFSTHLLYHHTLSWPEISFNVAGLVFCSSCFYRQSRPDRALLLNNRNITTIPKEIGEWTHLKKLNLSQNQDLSELPDEISQLRNLTDLNLSECNFSAIPEQLRGMTSLRELVLRGNKNVTSVPDWIYLLDQQCTVDLEETLLPDSVILAVEEKKNEVGYRGPTIHVSSVKQEWLARLFYAAGVDKEFKFDFDFLASGNDSTNDSTQMLTAWLQSMVRLVRSKTEGEKKKEKAMQIIGCLDKTQDGEEVASYRESFQKLLEISVNSMDQQQSSSEELGTFISEVNNNGSQKTYRQELLALFNDAAPAVSPSRE